MVGRLKPGISAKQAESDAETVAQEIMRNYPAMMANLHISAMVRPLQEETYGADPAPAADSLSGRRSGAADCVREPGWADAGASHPAAKRSCGSAGAGCESVGAVTSGNPGKPGAERERRSAWIGTGCDGAARRQERASREPAAHQRDRPELVRSRFRAALGVVTGLVCGLAPAFAAMRTNVNANLKEGGSSGSEGGGHARLRSTLVVAEIAIALVLLTASCLLLRSFEKMRVRRPGLPTRPRHHGFLFAAAEAVCDAAPDGRASIASC